MDFTALSASESEKLRKITEESVREEIDAPLKLIIGRNTYVALNESGCWYLPGVDREFGSLSEVGKYLEEDLIDEGLSYAKFRYRSRYPDRGYQIHDRHPHVLVLDADYIYNGRGKVVPGQHDVLAFNVKKYSEDFKEDTRAIQEIVMFAQLVRKDGKQDVYRRIRDLFPEALKYIRHYKPERMTSVKKKNGLFWRKCSVVDLGPTSDWD